MQDYPIVTPLAFSCLCLKQRIFFFWCDIRWGLIFQNYVDFYEITLILIHPRWYVSSLHHHFWAENRLQLPLKVLTLLLFCGTMGFTRKRAFKF